MEIVNGLTSTFEFLHYRLIKARILCVIMLGSLKVLTSKCFTRGRENILVPSQSNAEVFAKLKSTSTIDPIHRDITNTVLIRQQDMSSTIKYKCSLPSSSIRESEPPHNNDLSQSHFSPLQTPAL